ncbi:hypothetical protein [Streptomyces huiliensis]|uniref:hypothetical protein n=1 Tax=Streptomyces huiliensis TaxID=2876027 RepID=UPI001CBB0D48|nr:hypothetical protein [Streptomyces huiliensis]MBZ4320773.1 hypothetical protein [Streptomyces huiliensis]
MASFELPRLRPDEPRTDEPPLVESPEVVVPLDVEPVLNPPDVESDPLDVEPPNVPPDDESPPEVDVLPPLDELLLDELLPWLEPPPPQLPP